MIDMDSRGSHQFYCDYIRVYSIIYKRRGAASTHPPSKVIYSHMAIEWITMLV
jgi:hypothetical protein